MEPKPPIKKIEEESNLFERDKKMRNIIGEAYKKLSDEELYQFQEEVVARVRYLKSKYPNYANYNVMHILAGSSLVPSSENIKEDFHAEDSVEAFLDNLASRYRL